MDFGESMGVQYILGKKWPTLSRQMSFHVDDSIIVDLFSKMLKWFQKTIFLYICRWNSNASVLARDFWAKTKDLTASKIKWIENEVRSDASNDQVSS